MTRKQLLMAWTVWLIALVATTVWIVEGAWWFAGVPGALAVGIWTFILVRDWRWRREERYLTFAEIKLHHDGLFKRDVQ